MWYLSNQDSAGVPGEWHSEIEHIQNNCHWTFHTLEELLEFLQQKVEHPEGLEWTETFVESSQI